MSDNKKIAKNSLFLYLRLIITTLIGLYVSRVVLLQLGADDYGLYSVVGGVVVMMNFLSTTMLATTYRFIAVEIGKGEIGNPNKIFNASLIIHIALALLLILIGETVGVWYIHNYLNVLPEKIPDALFVLHFSIIATAFTVITIPYQGVVTAKEQFLARAIIETLKALIKLGLVLLLVIYTGNKLRAYAIIMTILMMLPLIAFYIYNKIKNNEIIKWKINKTRADYSAMFSFSSWILIGALAHMGTRQGAAIIINLFFGTILNAAFGIATQVYTFLTMFVNNLNQAAVPQIMKNHSAGDSNRSLSLVYSISKYAYFVMFIAAMPILLSLHFILKLWLKEVPEYTEPFVILMIVNGLIGISSSGFNALIQATGDIRKTQIWYSSILLLTLPVAYYMFQLGFPPYTITIITIGASILIKIVIMRILASLTDFTIIDYFKKTIVPILLVTIIILPLFLINNMFNNSLLGVVALTVISFVLMLPTILFFGLNINERLTIKKQLKKAFSK